MIDGSYIDVLLPQSTSFKCNNFSFEHPNLVPFTATAIYNCNKQVSLKIKCNKPPSIISETKKEVLCFLLKEPVAEGIAAFDRTILPYIQHRNKFRVISGSSHHCLISHTEKEQY